MVLFFELGVPSLALDTPVVMVMHGWQVALPGFSLALLSSLAAQRLTGESARSN